jgi:large conductance mechanosensitive channel
MRNLQVLLREYSRVAASAIALAFTRVTKKLVLAFLIGRIVMLSGFREFIARGNVLDLAVAVIIGAAFASITTSLTEDVIMPLIGAIFGGLDFSSYFLRLGPVPEGYTGSMTDYAALKKAGALMIGWGQFLTVVINFLILAFIIYQLVRAATRANLRREAEAVTAEEVLLLREIRDALKARGA